MTNRKVIPDLLPDTQYGIQVRAVGVNSVSEWSQREVFFTIPDLIQPKTPVNITWESVGNIFHAEWDSVIDNVNGDWIAVTRYEVELTSGGVTKVDSVPPATGNSKVTYDLTFEGNRALFGTPKANIAFRVRVVDNKELKSDWSTAVNASNPAPAPPTAPATGSVATGSMDSISLSWTAAADNDIVAYNVYIGTTAGFTPSSSNRIYSGLPTRFVYTTTNYSTQYFKIRSVDAFGQESTDLTGSASAASPFLADVTPPPVPTALAATLTNTPYDAGAVAQVSWTMTSPPTDLAGFVIRYRRVGSTNWAQVTTDKDARSITINLDQAYSNYEFQIKSYDWQANNSAYTSTVTGTGQANVAPAAPAAPSVAVNTQQIQVSVTGALDPDVTNVEVYASTTTNFTPAAANMLGVIPVGPAMVSTFQIPAAAASGAIQTWYVKVIAVDRGGLKSAASAQSSGNVALISSMNIGDATITSAKITSLEANKIVAGTGFVNNMTIKSKFTLGDASTTGTIESFGYVAGLTGFKLDKSSLEINQGSISASALKLQIGQNLMNPAYADFEFNPDWYTTNLSNGGGVWPTLTVANDATAKYNNQYLKIRHFSGTGSLAIYFATSAADYNFPVEPGETYILSWWMRNPTSVNVDSVNFRTVFNNGEWSGTPTGSNPAPAGMGWTRFYQYVTAPAGATKMTPNIYFSSLLPNAGVDVDGLQIEQKMGNLNTPSPWTPPGSTSMDGGMIRTGSMQSNQPGQVWDQTLNAGSGGYKNDPLGQPAWAINLNGNAVLNSALIRGNVVVGNQSDISLIDTSRLATMASATYVPGTQGWMLREDGQAEFRNVVAESFDGSAIITGSAKADIISSGTIISDITLAGSFETTSQSVDMAFHTTNGSATLTTSSTEPEFVPADVGVAVAGTNIPSDARIVTYNNPHSVTMNKPATVSAAAVPGVLYRGRSVRISGGDGIVLSDQYGKPVVSMPTNPLEPTKFTGSLVATDLFVEDEFRMFGQSNSLGQASVLNLEGGQFRPATYPKVQFSWEMTRTTSWGSLWSPDTDPYQNDMNGFTYDPTDKQYIYVYNFFGGMFQKIWGPGNLAAEGSSNGTIDISKSLLSGYIPSGGVAVNTTSNSFLFLTKHSTTGAWWAQQISRAGMNRAGGPIAADRIAAQPWAEATSGGMVGRPQIAFHAGNTYIAKMNSSNKIVILKYTGANVNTTSVKGTVTGASASGNITSVQVGQFDYGTGSTYVVVTVAGSSTGHRMNYVFIEGTSEFASTNYNFATPYEAGGVIGTAWVGTSGNDTAGYFKTFTSDGRIYKFTSLGAKTTATYITVSQRWRNNGSGGGLVAISPEGAVGQYALKKRGIITLSSAQTIPNTGGDTPNALTFYIGEGTGTRWRYDEPGTGVVSQTFDQFRTSNAGGTSVTMPVGIPSRIISAAGIEINGNGEMYGPYNPKRILSGVANIIFSGAQTAGLSISFPAGYFTAAPVVSVTPMNTTVFAGSAASASVNSFVAQATRLVTNAFSPTFSGTVTVHWTAVQQQ